MSVPSKIRQLAISPHGYYLAIATSHTLHVAVLPDPSHLVSQDASPLKLKAYQIGPTTHVLERSPLVSALWHPFGLRGSCLATVTEDAIIRLWELDRGNRESFDRPSWAVDLKKLADGVSSAEDFTPSKYRANEGFSPDRFEMEVAAACFGAHDVGNEVGWAAMTLWVAMREGDIYVLCPILPAKMELPDSFISNLTASISIQSAVAGSDQNLSAGRPEVYLQQSSWTTAILEQKGSHENQTRPRQVYDRPSRPSIPKLQGPFRIRPDRNQIFDVTDIHPISRTATSMDILDNTRDVDEGNEGDQVPIGMLCVGTADGQVHLLLQDEEPEAQWLQPHRVSLLARAFHSKSNNVKAERLPQQKQLEFHMPKLIRLETLKICDPCTYCWPMFTPDVQSPTGLFVTHSYGVSHFNVSRWIHAIADEISGISNQGSKFRVDVIIDATRTEPSRVISSTAGDGVQVELMATQSVLPACVALADPSLGVLVVTTSPATNEPQAVELDTSDLDEHLGDGLLEADQDNNVASLIPREVSRWNYQIPAEFYGNSQLANIMEQQSGLLHLRTSGLYKEEVKMSDLTLRLLMEAHQSLGAETLAVGKAAADLFRGCARLQEEFGKQIARANAVAGRVEAVLGDEADVYETRQDGVGDHRDVEQRDVEQPSSVSIEDRLETARERQSNILERYEALRNRIKSRQGRPIGEREARWISEVEGMRDLIISSKHGRTAATEDNSDTSTANGNAMASNTTNGVDHSRAGDGESHKLWHRFDSLFTFKQQLMVQSSGLVKEDKEALEQEDLGASTGLSPEGRKGYRKTRLEQINSMLERESALVESATEKLEIMMVQVGA